MQHQEGVDIKLSLFEVITLFQSSASLYPSIISNGLLWRSYLQSIISSARSTFADNALATPAPLKLIFLVPTMFGLAGDT
ncbi:hypothetical protein TNCV_1677221 [Trichonephila clavipes]|nr:hypothetical protein TNCV_1677201 [Trichonephila clavipes]GFV32435.1 hypothetical protein TNCV_1677211 [Trichonephila clavipes]GFV32436.1 hypothetical protein TNCV_1677221 [Trichonephila clavipes]